MMRHAEQGCPCRVWLPGQHVHVLAPGWDMVDRATNTMRFRCDGCGASVLYFSRTKTLSDPDLAWGHAWFELQVQGVLS